MKNKSYMYIILAGLLWGTSGIFVNLLVTYGFTALQLTFFRGAVSFVKVFFGFECPLDIGISPASA